MFVASAGPGVKPECARNDANSSPRGQVEGLRPAAPEDVSFGAKGEFDRAPRLFWWHWENLWLGPPGDDSGGLLNRRVV